MNDELHKMDREKYENDSESYNFNKRKQIVKLVGTAIFAAISVLLYVTKVPPFVFPIFPPPFNILEINFSEVPALIAGFAYGPVSGFLVLLIRMLVKLPLSSTAFVGELADIIYSSSFVITAALFYKYDRSFKGVLRGLGIAFVMQIFVSTFANYFVIYDLYVEIFTGGHGLPFTVSEFIKYVIPFNIIKNLIIAVITLLVYKRISRFINTFY